jgi:hypothetical protein
MTGFAMRPQTDEANASSQETTNLLSVIDWNWFSEYDVENITWRFVALPNGPWRVFLRMIGSGQVGKHEVKMVSEDQAIKMDDWMQRVGVCLGTRDEPINDYVTGQQRLREAVKMRIAERPELARTPTPEETP